MELGTFAIAMYRSQVEQTKTHAEGKHQNSPRQHTTTRRQCSTLVLVLVLMMSGGGRDDDDDGEEERGLTCRPRT